MPTIKRETSAWTSHLLIGLTLVVSFSQSPVASATAGGKCRLQSRDQKGLMQQVSAREAHLRDPLTREKTIDQLDDLTQSLKGKKIGSRLAESEMDLIFEFLDSAMALSTILKNSEVPMEQRIAATIIGFRMVEYLSTDFMFKTYFTRVFHENFTGIYQNLSLPEAIRRIAFENGDRNAPTFRQKPNDQFYTKQELLELDTPEFATIPYSKMNQRQRVVASALSMDHHLPKQPGIFSELTLNQKIEIFDHAAKGTQVTNRYFIKHFLLVYQSQSLHGHGRSSANIISQIHQIFGWKYLEITSTPTSLGFTLGPKRILSLENARSQTPVTTNQILKLYQAIALETGDVIWDAHTNTRLTP